MAFTTSGQETEWALFLQPRRPHGASKDRSSCKNVTKAGVKLCLFSGNTVSYTHLTLPTIYSV